MIRGEADQVALDFYYFALQRMRTEAPTMQQE